MNLDTDNIRKENLVSHKSGKRDTDKNQIWKITIFDTCGQVPGKHKPDANYMIDE